MKKLIIGLFIFVFISIGSQVNADVPTIVVTSPNNGGESLEVGGRIEIRWTSPNIMSALNEVYISDGINRGHTETVRMDNNQGSVIYTLDNNLIPGSNYRAYVSIAYGSAISASDVSDFPFTIKPVLTSCSISNFTVNGVSSVTVSNTEGAVLSYATTNCTSVSISSLSSDNGFKLSDTFQIYHPQTRDYILTAFGSNGTSVSRSVHITVGSTTTPSITLDSNPKASNGSVTINLGEAITFIGSTNNLIGQNGVDYIMSFNFDPIFNGVCNQNSIHVLSQKCIPTQTGTGSFSIQVTQNGRVYNSNVIRTNVVENNAGCYGARYSVTTGRACPLSMVTEEGCYSGLIFSSTTGQRCPINNVPTCPVAGINSFSVCADGKMEAASRNANQCITSYKCTNPNNDLGCKNNETYSSITNQLCLRTNNIDKGCPTGAVYSSTTGRKCLNTVVETDSGCAAGRLYSITTGRACSVDSSRVRLTKTWRWGDRGDEVKIIQRYFGLYADGVYGRGTVLKVKEWQIKNGLYPDGSFGAMSRRIAGLE